MNRKELIEGLKKAGYTGPSDLASVEAWIKEQNIVPEDADGKPVDIKAAFTATKKVKIAFTADAGEEVEIEGGKAACETPAEGEMPAMEKSAESMIRKSRAATFSAGKAPATTGKFGSERKAYDLRVKSGRALLSSGEVAEQFGATIRLALAHAFPSQVGSYGQKSNDLEIVGKAQSAIVSNNGAVLIPQEYIAELIWLTEQYGVARKLANVQRMNSDNAKRPRKTGIPSMAATAPGAQISTGTVNYDLVNLNAKAWKLLIQSPNELLEDSAVNVADDIARTFAESQAVTEDTVYFTADGTATYNNCEGLVGGLVAGAYQNAAGNSWSAITEANIETLFGTVQNVNWRRCRLACSRQFYYSVMRPLQYGKGGVTATEAIQGVALPGGADALWKGTPVHFVEVMPTTSASGSKVLYFGDFEGGSMLGVRNDLAISTDESLKFDYDSIVWRGRSRFDVNIHGDGRGTTYGPIVCLQTT